MAVSIKTRRELIALILIHFKNKGNLVAIFASRLSTSIHRTSVRGEYPSWTPQKYIYYPYQTFFGKLSILKNPISNKICFVNVFSVVDPEASTARLLALLILPGHMIFFFTLYYLKAIQSGIELTVWLVLFYLLFAFVQVVANCDHILIVMKNIWINVLIFSKGDYIAIALLLARLVCVEAQERSGQCVHTVFDLDRRLIGRRVPTALYAHCLFDGQY